MGEGRGRLSAEEVAQLTEQLAGLSAAGLPLPAGFRALAEEQTSRRFRAVLYSLAGSLERGEPLAEAFEAQGTRLPAHLRGLVMAGLRTGRLGLVLGRFVTYTNFGADLRRGLWLKLSLPLLAWTLVFGLSGFFLVALAAPFKSIFKDFGIPVPLITRVLIALSDLIVELSPSLPWLIGGLCLAVFVTALAVNGPQRRSLAAHVPLLGWVWRLTSLAELSHLLGLLLESEVPLGDALLMAGEGVRDSQLDRACRQTSADVQLGLSLSQAVARRQLFPASLARVLDWAEKHRSLPEALHMAAEMFESRARAHSAFTIVVFNVLTVVIIGFGIALLLGAILLPMLSLLSKLGI